MAAHAGLCLAWSETPEDTFCRVVAQIYMDCQGIECRLGLYLSSPFINVVKSFAANVMNL